MSAAPLWEVCPDAAVALEEKVAALKSPACYRQSTSAVAAVETHLSWVFLTDRHAFKLKKPLRSPVLDFSGLVQRQHFCEEEVRLNRRLAAPVYLGVRPLVRAADGNLRIGGRGAIVDYLVQMRRLPAEGMLDRAIQMRRLNRRDIRAVACRLVAFYRGAEPVAMEPASYRERLRRRVLNCRAELLRPHYCLPRALIERLADAQLRFIDANRELPGRASHVLEAHGDLRPEHVYLGPPVQIIDCLEFDRDLRLLDSADELAFLALECARLGAPRCGWKLLRIYRALTGDAVSDNVLRFYQSCHACTRARLAIWHWDDKQVRERERWHERALQYLELARATVPAAAQPRQRAGSPC